MKQVNGLIKRRRLWERSRMILKCWLSEFDSSSKIEGKVEGLSRSEGERKVYESGHLEVEWCDCDKVGIWRMETITGE